MKTYKVTYKETLVHTFYVEAENEEEAEENFKQGLMDGAFDFSDGEVDETDYSVKECDDKYHYHYTPSSTNGDYSPGAPWLAPGMSEKDFIQGGTTMKTFMVTIEEHVSQTFAVETNDIEEAMEIAEEKYNNGEFVLEPGVVNAKLMMADDGDGDCTEWTEF